MLYSINYHYILNKLVGFTYNKDNKASNYIYRRNIQGDIIGIYDSLGNEVGWYAYDAYGKCYVKYKDNSSEEEKTILNTNPFRYRWYYYDNETGLYYLNARYYDPGIGRFISPDVLTILDETKGQLNGLNLYMYCNNNPIMYVDPSGRLFGMIFAIIVITALLLATANDIYQIKNNVKVSVTGENLDAVHIKDSYKILTPWMRYAYGFYLNHFNSKTKDIIQGSTAGVQFEWELHNLAAWLGIGGDSAKEVDIGKSIFADGKAHPLKDEYGNITSEGVMSIIMRIGYILSGNPVYWIWDLKVNGGF